MFSNYLKTALRSLIRQKYYALINLFGLSVGIASFLLIALYVQYEVGFDSHLIKRDRLFRVVEIQNEPGVGEQHVAITMGPLAERMKADFPQVTRTCRLVPGFNIQVVSFGEKSFREKDLYYADPSVIELFEIDLVIGSPVTVLTNPRSVLLSEKAAAKYFGKAENAVGKILLMGKRGFTVTGIMRDQPKNTHMFFDILVSVSSVEGLSDFQWMEGWDSNSLITYVQLDKPESRETVESGFPPFLKKYIFTQKDGWQYLEMYLQPVSEIYLQSQHIKFQNTSAGGDRNMVIIFIVVAVLILTVACVNFINISIARSVKHAREVGIRKVLGADRLSLIYQFISESFLITLVSLVLSIGLVELFLPQLNQLLGTSFFIDFRENRLFNVGLMSILIVITLASGSYPAFYLSQYEPARVLKGSVSMRGSSAGILSKVLVVFQFMISVGLIFAILVINEQVAFMRTKKLGISYENAVFVPFGDSEASSRLAVIREELLRNPAIKAVAGCSFINGVSGSQGPVIVGDSADTKLTVRFGYVDYDFFEAMGISFTAGRNFNRNIIADAGGTVILNEAAVRKLGWTNAIGKTFKFVLGADTNRRTEVIGVIRDYHYYSLRSLIEPAAYVLATDRFRGVIVSYYRDSDKDKVIAFIGDRWKSIFSDTPFQTVFAQDFAMDGYKKEKTIFSLFIYFTAISVVLSCLGLFGLTSLMIEQKTRSIGIRRVLGGQTWQIALKLVREYLVLVFLAGAIALPVTYLLLERQLDQYAYRIDIGYFNMFLSLAIIVVISFITTVFKAFQAANANPVLSIKYE